MIDRSIAIYLIVISAATAFVLVGMHNLMGWSPCFIVIGLVLFIVAREAKDDDWFGVKQEPPRPTKRYVISDDPVKQFELRNRGWMNE